MGQKLIYESTALFGLSRHRAEIDTTSRWIKITFLYFGKWTKTLVDCPLDECASLGTIEYNTDGHIAFGVYIEQENGKRDAIPLKSGSFETAAMTANQLSAATRIPRVDTKYP